MSTSPRRAPRPVRIAAALLTAWSAAPAAAQDPAPVEVFDGGTLASDFLEGVRYGRDIRPLLADRCFRCHGPDANTREADLRLDRRDDALAPRDGGAAIVPGSPLRSLLYQRICSADPDERMPPAHAQKPVLTTEQIGLIERWIEAGAPYEEHWAFVPPERPAVPAAGDGWARNPIDRFIAADLAARRLQPNPEAGPATLARRAFLVLTGLPPTPAELDAFLADTRPDAYDRLVDRLLDEEPYRSRHAEHLAAPWLDAARYADTCGIHMDAGRQIWPWRDWLLRSLRDDLPFDEFVVDQLAGDLLPDANLDQRVATGFLRAHVTTDEGGAIDSEYLVEYAAERTATVGSVFFGLTLGCARCHDHKFDPITQRDYYSLFAYFYNNDEPGLYTQSRDPNRALEPALAVPSADENRERSALAQERAAAATALATVDAAEVADQAAFFAGLARDSGIAWPPVAVLDAASTAGATLTVEADGAVFASGENPARDTNVVTLLAKAPDLRLLCVEALPDPRLPEQKVGRAVNGNAVLNHVRLEVRPAGSREEWQQVPLGWAIADVEQRDGDYRVTNALFDDDRGWAVAAHQLPPGPRRALFLADRPFGEAAGTEIRVTLEYDSIYAQHAFGRVRLHVGQIGEPMLARLPAAASGFYRVEPFAGTPEELYDAEHGPEHSARIDLAERWGKKRWVFDPRLATGTVFDGLPKGTNASYLGRELYSPTARTFAAAVGSDDGFQLFVDGRRVAERRVDRPVAAEQDHIEFELPAGRHAVVYKIVNTGGFGGFYWRDDEAHAVLADRLALWLLPPHTRTAADGEALAVAWRERFSPGFRAKQERVAAADRRLAELDAMTPQTMVMRERGERRPTYLLMRGEYDKPDRSQPLQPALPAMFGIAPDSMPRDRLAFARWLVSERNPLLHRVAVNRLFEFVFGTGIVRTSEDFGRQGEWPSHPELLDWLALEFRARGTSMRSMLRLLCTSATFRQSARRNEAAAAVDGDDRLLGWFPRRRLTAEAIRDSSLYTGGLLIERFGGPSVKPYQPAGLWREVAMVQSNTRVFERDDGDALWRRSLYTYWKRACPPPTLLTLDAPTREFCTIRRSITNTPLQALALWNDEQFVEAARALAERTLRETPDDRTRLAAMYRRCTGHDLRDAELERALATLHELRRRYHAAPADAATLLGVGDSPRDEAIPAPEHAAFTLLANAFLNLDATLYID
ncbi:MAG: PSD1 domain-containing protein, partial [Planctomycetes bacterium]|nr:PSD1 domain-containing protein [Planctomycetota bacterium]